MWSRKDNDEKNVADFYDDDADKGSDSPSWKEKSERGEGGSKKKLMYGILLLLLNLKHLLFVALKPLVCCLYNDAGFAELCVGFASCFL